MVGGQSELGEGWYGNCLFFSDCAVPFLSVLIALYLLSAMMLLYPMAPVERFMDVSFCMFGGCCVFCFVCVLFDWPVLSL